jgi:DNA-binding NtrC family response regulator
MLTRVIVAVEPRSRLRRIRDLLKGPGVSLEPVLPRGAPWEEIARSTADLVVVSRGLIPKPLEDAISLVRGSPESPAIVVIAERDDADDRARLLAIGCEAVVPPRVATATLRELFAILLERRRSEGEQTIRVAMAPDQPRLSDFVSASPAMQAFMEVVERVVEADSSLLILGETGVGKERLARAIHAESTRSTGPFVAVNCGALPENLLESELFGHEEGAFTGATRARRGWFELAHGGTLFLDEVGELPLHLQVKLLRALQEHAFQPLGSERTIQVDVRVMAASNQDLEHAVEQGTFRGDLFYRLGVISLTVPALRDRAQDIPSLAESYIALFASTIGRGVEGISGPALDALARYPWPGNVRELMNVIERAVLLCKGTRIDLVDLPEAIVAPHERVGDLLAGPVVAGDAARLPDAWLERPWHEVRCDVLARVERAYLAGLLEETNGRVGETARRAGMEPRSLYAKMKRLRLRKEDYRPERGSAGER